MPWLHCNARVYPTPAQHISYACHVCKRKLPNKVIPLLYPRYPRYPHKGYGFVGGNKFRTLTPTPHTPQQKPGGFQNPCHSLAAPRAAHTVNQSGNGGSCWGCLQVQLGSDSNKWVASRGAVEGNAEGGMGVVVKCRRLIQSLLHGIG